LTEQWMLSLRLERGGMSFISTFIPISRD